jgi:hypothetical protein
MKERPILFSAPMVRAILSGVKTQTRRVAKTVTSLPDGKGYTCLQRPGSNTVLPLVDGQWQWQPAAGDAWRPYPRMEEYCPYGKPGDRLWVRETWAPMIGGGYVYAADYTDQRLKEKDGHGFWKPSIFCKRETSRITLEIVSVRVERLQKITEADAIAEGIEAFVMDLEGSTVTTFRDYLTGEMNRAARNSYETLWQSMNGTESWAGNPFVWVIEFKTL